MTRARARSRPESTGVIGSSPFARGVITLTALCLVPVILWATAQPIDARFATRAATLGSIGVIFGLAGVSSFALNLFLGARFWFVESFLGGLDNLYRLHRGNGRVAYLLLLTHGVLELAAQESVAAAVDLVSPSGAWTVTLGAISLVAMTLAIGLTLYARLGHETFVYVQRTFGLIFMVALVHVFRTPGTKSISPALKYYLALLAAAGVVGWLYRSLLGDLLVRRYDYVVSGVNHFGPDVIEISMRPTDHGMAFTPGQFMFVTFDSPELDAELRPLEIESEGRVAVVSFRPGAVHGQFHPFSITAAPDDHDLRVTVKAIGDYTTAMQKLGSGAAVRVEGPYGSFSHRKAVSTRQIWIAGGIGITPFLSMARSLEPNFEVDLYYCVEHPEEAYFLDELTELAARHDAFRVILYPRETKGFITAAVVVETSGPLEGTDVLICGPAAMIESLRPQFIAAGLPRARLHYELFRFAG